MTTPVIRCTEYVIPNSRCHTEVHFREGVMDFVMNSEFAVPPVREIKVMMDVMKHTVKEEASREPGEEAKKIGDLEVDADDKPDQNQKACCEKPGHADECLGFFMM